MIPDDSTHSSTYPSHHHVAQSLPFSLRYVIFSNYFFAINGWSVFYYMLIIIIFFQININFIYIMVMLIPSLILSALSIIISKELLQRSNIVLSLSHVLMGILLLDMLNSGPISTIIQAEISFSELQFFLISLIFLSLILSNGAVLMLIFNKSLQLYYLNKDLYLKPWFIRNFGVTSILASIPLILLYIYTFNS